MIKFFEDKDKLHRLLFWSIFVFGAFIRVLLLGRVPAGVHPDEAFAGYEAYSMLKYGVDSWGFHMPVYFVSWGSGMNVLETYLMMPFVALLGLNELTIRIPQVIFGICCMPAMYGLLRRVVNKKLGLIGMLVVAISPWQFMYSRWGCESNLCPAMLLIASYFLVSAMKAVVDKTNNSRRYFVLAAIFFGLDMYCYAATWILVAAVILVWAIYFICFCKKNGVSLDRGIISSFVIFAVILALFAMPLILFIMVNMDIIPQISGFISIPRMVVFRGDEVMDTSVLMGRVHYFAHILVAQEDGRPWNAIAPYGLFYSKLSIIVIVFGVVSSIRVFICDIKNKRFSYSFLLLAYATIASLLVIIQRVDIISSNYLQIVLLVFWAIGIYKVLNINKRWSTAVVCCFYLVMVVMFLNVYFRYYPKLINESLPGGGREALAQALELYENESVSGIVVTDSLSHAQVLFYTEYPVYDYINSVTWMEYPSKYLAARSFGPFMWDAEDEQTYDTDKAYIITSDELLDYKAMGFDITEYGNLYLAVY